jgi:hypothetical protein
MKTRSCDEGRVLGFGISEALGLEVEEHTCACANKKEQGAAKKNGWSLFRVT